MWKIIFVGVIFLIFSSSNNIVCSETLSEKDTSFKSYDAQVVVIKAEIAEGALDTAEKIGIFNTPGVFISKPSDKDYKLVLEKLEKLDKELNILSTLKIITLENKVCAISISDVVELQMITKIKENNLIAVNMKWVLRGIKEPGQEVEVIVKEDERIIFFSPFIKEVREVTTKTIPMLGEIPLVGALFRTKEEHKKQSGFIISIIFTTNELTSQK